MFVDNKYFLIVDHTRNLRKPVGHYREAARRKQHPNNISLQKLPKEVIAHAETTVKVYTKEEWERCGKTVQGVRDKGTPIATGVANCSMRDSFSRSRGLLIAGNRAFKGLGKKLIRHRNSLTGNTEWTVVDLLTPKSSVEKQGKLTQLESSPNQLKD